jgi:hypothetical protein
MGYKRVFLETENMAEENTKHQRNWKERVEIIKVIQVCGNLSSKCGIRYAEAMTYGSLHRYRVGARNLRIIQLKVRILFSLNYQMKIVIEGKRL